MLRATRVLPAGKWGVSADTVVLDYDGRHRRRMAMEGAGGLGFLLDLNDAVALRDGDGLALEDGRIVAVVAAPEPLAEITAANPARLLRLAWHLGNRHLPAELAGSVIRIRRDHVIEEMVEGLGGLVQHIEAAFDPEGGAYHGGGHHHHHDHDHGEHHEHDDRLGDVEVGGG
ncbi:MAG: urease accessory protein UreE [Bauldia sp.]